MARASGSNPGVICVDQMGWACDRFAGNGGSCWREPSYSFLNTKSGVQQNISVETDKIISPLDENDWFVPDADYFIYTTTSIGATGIGAGTIGARPGSCSLEYSGYWATDEGTWNQEDAAIHAAHPTEVAATHSQGQDGKMYLCISGTWTALYVNKVGGEPYTYPHPLRGDSADVTPPVVTITDPTSDPTHVAFDTPLTTLAGTCTDAGGVQTVTWANSLGGSGIATGTTSWSVASINLEDGENIITVTCTDTSSNQHHDSVAVTYTPTPPPPTGRPRSPFGRKVMNVLEWFRPAVYVWRFAW
jgi:hypothetical protein